CRLRPRAQLLLDTLSSYGHSVSRIRRPVNEERNDQMTEPAPSSVWTRPRPEPRRRAPGVNQYVAAALAVAYAESLAAVSMRRVAGDLGSGTATLYRYIASRDELVDLMVDAAQGEDPLPEP